MTTMGKVEFQGNSTVGTVNNASNSTYLQVAGTPWTANQYVGRIISFQGSGNSGNTYMGRIANNTANTLYMNDVLSNTAGVSNNSTSGTFTPNSSFNYQIGLVNRGQILPQQLYVASDAACLVELIVSTASNPVSLSNANFIPLNTLGAFNSLGSRDLSANAVTANTGEVIWSVSAPSGGSGLQTFDLTNLFAIYNNIRGNAPDILTVAISTPTNAANVGAQLIAQEAMS